MEFNSDFKHDLKLGNKGENLLAEIELGRPSFSHRLSPKAGSCAAQRQQKVLACDEARPMVSLGNMFRRCIHDFGFHENMMVVALLKSREEDPKRFFANLNNIKNL